jgi:hypothetical protein
VFCLSMRCRGWRHPTTIVASGSASVQSIAAVRHVPRIALSVAEAAVALGVSPDFFTEHIAPELRLVRRGRKKLVAVRELEAWLERTAARTVD